MIETDPILQNLVKIYPAPAFTDRSDFLYEDLLETIISQQLSIKAANTIFLRFKKIFGQNTVPPPHDILRITEEKLRYAGLSRQKIGYIKDIAQAFLDKNIDTETMKSLSDEEAILALTKLKGVGKWTAEMILIFTLKRPDVFSAGDTGIRNAIRKLYGIIEQNDMIRLAEQWKPYRSTACWYLWQSLKNK